MNTYAVLGSTGNCGTALIQNLLKSPTAKVHAICRNRNKLIGLLLQMESNKQVEVFEGSIHNVSFLTECLRGCHAVFLCISTNDNIPGCRMATDTALSVIGSLEVLKAEQNSQQHFHAPKLVQLSLNTPPLVH